MYRIGVIGDYESICGFAALGIDIYGADSIEDAEKTLKKLAESGFGIIYIAENYLEKMPKVQEKYKDSLIPAIIPLPLGAEPTGFGIRNVKRYVEQAVGSDIIFGE